MSPGLGFWPTGGKEMAGWVRTAFPLYPTLTPVHPSSLTLTAHTQPNAHTPGSAVVLPRATNPSCPSTKLFSTPRQHPNSKDHSYTHVCLTCFCRGNNFSAILFIPTNNSIVTAGLFFACLYTRTFSLAQTPLLSCHTRQYRIICGYHGEQESLPHNRYRPALRSGLALKSRVKPYPIRHHTTPAPSSPS